MRYLLDTNILSEIRKSTCDPSVARWIQKIDPDLCYISVLTIGEIRRGIDLVKNRDHTKAQTLQRWLDQLIELYSERIIPIDIATSLEWGKISAIRTLPPIDALLAASAIQNHLTLVTRNVSDFKEIKIKLLNPFE